MRTPQESYVFDFDTDETTVVVRIDDGRWCAEDFLAALAGFGLGAAMTLAAVAALTP